MVKEPTREDRTLDILLTNHPGAVTRVETLPPLGKADHNAVFIESNIRLKANKQPPRKVYLYKKADFDGIKTDMQSVAPDFEKMYEEQEDANTLWNFFKSKLQETTEKHIPHKMMRPNNGLPWVPTELKRQYRKEERIHKKVRQGKKNLKPRLKALK